MDDIRYQENQADKCLEHEKLCKRCGACCGVLEHTPCEHLKKGKDEFYFCDIYENRFGLHKTITGEPVLCVPIRNVLHKTWWGRIDCAYYNLYRNVVC
ncbi:MAG: hypothetical protein QGI05_00850 [Candidatus Omnitrophota bacterium]|nr:hypothetical protein [Candidatus Omnitrophota bacterium]